MRFPAASPMPEALTYRCPFCDHEVRVGQPCPGCAKKAKPKPPKKRAKKSWEQSATYDGLNLPDDDFDYDEFVSREFGKAPHQTLGVAWHWWLLGVFLLALLIAGAFQLGAL